MNSVRKVKSVLRDKKEECFSLNSFNFPKIEHAITIKNSSFETNSTKSNF